MDVEGASLALTGLTSNGVGAELSGDFAFEQSGGLTKVGVSNVTASVDVNGTPGGDLEQGKGAILVTESGVAGTLEGKLQSDVGGVAANATLVLHFNNTGTVVNEELLVGDDRIKIIFGSADNVFSISLLEASLNLGGVITIEGSLTCLLYTSPSPRDLSTSRMPSSA